MKPEVRRRRLALLAFALAALGAGFAVAAATRQENWHTALVSTFGAPGEPLACGGTLQPGQLGVANRTLPCGTSVVLRRQDKGAIVQVIDRGPYVAGRTFDLTPETAARLDMGDGLARIEWRRH